MSELRKAKQYTKTNRVSILCLVAMILILLSLSYLFVADFKALVHL